MKKLYSYQYMSLLFMMPLIAVFALRRGVSWGEWLMLLPLGIGMLALMWSFLKGSDLFSACAVFGKFSKAAAIAFAFFFAASCGGVLAVSAKHAAETIFLTYPPWIVALPIAAACVFAAFRGAPAIGRAGFVFAAAAAVVLGGVSIILAFYGKRQNAPFRLTGGGAITAAVFMADGISAAVLRHHAPRKGGFLYPCAYAAGGILGAVFLAVTEAASESVLPSDNAGGLVRVGMLITPLIQLAAFFIAAYRISVGLSAAGECAAMSLGIKRWKAIALAGGMAAAAAALFIFTEMEYVYIAVYALPVLLAALGIILQKIKKAPV